MNANTKEISEILLHKSATKQFIYRNTMEYFNEFKSQLKSIEKELKESVTPANENVKIECKEEGQFEVRNTGIPKSGIFARRGYSGIRTHTRP